MGWDQFNTGHRGAEGTESAREAEDQLTSPEVRKAIEGPDPRLNAITHRIIAAAIEVRREPGPGYLEAYYEAALAIEFEKRGLKFSRQHSFSVLYKGVVIGSGRLDFLVEDDVVVELKSVESLAPVHTAQVLSYLKAVNRKLGLIINFNEHLLKNGLRRVAR